MDAAGNVRVTDRLKDMYVTGGFNVYPAEVEAALRAHPSVAQVAVVGVPDTRMGEVGLAVVVPSAAVAADDLERQLVEWAAERLANFKVPRSVRVVDELPVNAGGKVLKRELRERFGEPAGSGAPAGSGGPTAGHHR
jgi:acyl-CoA synthetase (AMP-forming)/AMP-acid ligase II